MRDCDGKKRVVQVNSDVEMKHAETDGESTEEEINGGQSPIVLRKADNQDTSDWWSLGWWSLATLWKVSSPSRLWWRGHTGGRLGWSWQGAKWDEHTCELRELTETLDDG